MSSDTSEKKSVDKGERRILGGCLLVLLLLAGAMVVTLSRKNERDTHETAKFVPRVLTVTINGEERTLDTSKQFQVRFPERSSFMAHGVHWQLKEYMRISDEVSKEQRKQYKSLGDVPEKLYRQLCPSDSGRGVHPSSGGLDYYTSPGSVVVYYRQHISEICDSMHLWYEPVEAWMVIDPQTAIEVEFEGATYHVVPNGKTLHLTARPTPQK